MDGKVLPLSEFKPGITAPPLHCRCRSTTCPYFDDEFTEGETRAARDPVTGKTVQVDGKLNYEEWKKKYVDKPAQESLTREEEMAIMRYVGGESYVLNEKLRNSSSLSVDELCWMDDLDTALGKLPSYQGHLQRSLDFYDEEVLQGFLKQHEQGAKVQYPAYTSMTAGTEIYNPDGQVQIFVLQSKLGRDIQTFNDGEQEVLYRRGAKFEVKRIKRIGEQYYIYLEEIADG